jgi:hypothetical protein
MALPLSRHVPRFERRWKEREQVLRDAIHGPTIELKLSRSLIQMIRKSGPNKEINLS